MNRDSDIKVFKTLKKPKLSSDITPESPCEEQSTSLLFYYTDIINNFDNEEHSVLLFGKLDSNTLLFNDSKLKSCCIQVRGIPHKAHILKSEVSEEQFREIERMSKEELSGKVKVDIVRKGYCFQGIANAASSTLTQGEQEYIRVTWTAHTLKDVLPRISFTLLQEFQDNCEAFLIQNQIKGPRWLQIRNLIYLNEGDSQKRTHCVKEAVVNFHDVISEWHDKDQRTPPSLKAVILGANDKKRNEEIVTISSVIMSFNFGRSQNKYEQAHIFRLKQKEIDAKKAEKMLVSRFTKFIQEEDPDIILCHDFEVSRWTDLIARGPQDQRHIFSRLRKGCRSFECRCGPKRLLAGRILIDLLRLAPMLIEKCTYLSVAHLLKGYRKDLNSSFLADNYQPQSAEELASILEKAPVTLKDVNMHLLTEKDQRVIPMLMFSALKETPNAIIPCFKLKILAESMHMAELTFAFSQLTGSPWNAVLSNFGASQIDWMLNMNFYAKNYILPPIINKNALQSSVETLKGGHILKYLQRFEKDSIVLLLDFSSFYPSLFKELNLCFSTYFIDSPANSQNKKYLKVNSDNESFGIIPSIQEQLLQERKTLQSRQNEKNMSLKVLAELLQKEKAIKLVCNTIYGCLGWKGSRYCSKAFCQILTDKGREVLEDLSVYIKDILKLDVLGGTIDSILVVAGTKDPTSALSVGYKIQDYVASKYKSLSIKIDALFFPFIVWKTNCYAGRPLKLESHVQTSLEDRLVIKGFRSVRRDTCDLVKEIVDVCLNWVFKESNNMRELYELLNCKFDAFSDPTMVERFIVYQKIGKKDSSDIEHVRRRMEKLSHEKKTFRKILMEFREGRYIPLLKVKDSNQRSFFIHFSEWNVNNGDGEKLYIDREWYLRTQTLPAITELFEPIPNGKLLVSELGSKFCNIVSPQENHAHALSRDGMRVKNGLLSEIKPNIKADKLNALVMGCSMKAAVSAFVGQPTKDALKIDRDFKNFIDAQKQQILVDLTESQDEKNFLYRVFKWGCFRRLSEPMWEYIIRENEKCLILRNIPDKLHENLESYAMAFPIDAIDSDKPQNCLFLDYCLVEVQACVWKEKERVEKELHVGRRNISKAIEVWEQEESVKTSNGKCLIIKNLSVKAQTWLEEEIIQRQTEKIRSLRTLSIEIWKFLEDSVCNKAEQLFLKRIRPILTDNEQ